MVIRLACAICVSAFFTCSASAEQTKIKDYATCRAQKLSLRHFP